MPSLLVSAYDNVDRTVYTTASVRPTEGKIVVAWVTLRKATATATTPTLSGNGLTWDLVTNTTPAAITTYMFRALASSPSAGAVTITLDGTTHVGAAWIFVEYDSLDTGGTNGANSTVQTALDAQNNVNASTVTLSAFANAKNLTAGAAGIANGVETVTAGTGFTTIATNSGGTPSNSLTALSKPTNDTTVEWSWPTTASVRSIAAELKASTADFFVRNILSEGYTTDATGHTTSTISVTSGRLYIISWWNRISGTAAQPTLSVSNGDTPAIVHATLGTQLLTNDDYRVTMFRWRSSSTANVTITSAYGQTAITAGCDVGEVFGEDTSGTNGSGAVTQAENNAQAFADPGVVTLGSGVNSRSITYGAFIVNAAAAGVLPTTGFTGHGETGLTEAAMNLITVSKANSTTASVATGNVLYGGVAIELKRAPVEGAGAIAGSGAVSAAGAHIGVGGAAVAGAGAVSSTGVRMRLGQAAVAGAGAVSSTGVRVRLGSVALTGSGTVSASGDVESGSATIEGQAAFTATGAVSATGAHIGVGAAALTGTGTVSASGAHIGVGQAALTGSGAVSATGLRTRSGQASLTGTGTVSASGTRVTTQTAAITGSGSVSATGVRKRLGQATLTGAGAVNASGFVVTGAPATLTGAGSVSVSGVRVRSGAATLTGTGVLSATGTIGGAATIVGTGSISATGTRTTAQTAALTGTGTISGSGTVTTSSTVAITGAGSVTVTGVRVRAGQAALTGSGSVSASGTRVVVGLVTLTATGSLSATGIRHRSGQATITATGVLVATGQTADASGTPGTITVTVTQLDTASVSVVALDELGVSVEYATADATVVASDELEPTVAHVATVASTIEGGT